MTTCSFAVSLAVFIAMPSVMSTGTIFTPIELYTRYSCRSTVVFGAVIRGIPMDSQKMVYTSGSLGGAGLGGCGLVQEQLRLN